jgi:antitoxin component of MazEF toxin-antitoxin module
MLVIRRLSRRGNSFNITIPPQMINHLRLAVTDAIAVELTDHGSIELRLAHERDFRVGDVRPMNLVLPAAVSK